MPLYEYECLNCRGENGKHLVVEIIRPIARRLDPLHCQACRGLLRLLMSASWWSMGWEYLKSKPHTDVPTDAGYYPEFDQAYSPAGDHLRKA